MIGQHANIMSYMKLSSILLLSLDRMFPREHLRLPTEPPLHTRMPDDVVTTREAAMLLGYTVQHTRRLLRTGVLAGIKAGRDWIIDRESVARRLARRANLRLPFHTSTDPKLNATRQKVNASVDNLPSSAPDS